MLSSPRDIFEHVNEAQRARHDQHLDEIVEVERQINYWQARQLRAIAALADDPLPLPSITEARDKRWVREELACELKVSSMTAGFRLTLACSLVGNAEGLVKLLETGEITMRHLYVFADATKHLTDEQQQAVADRVRDRAPSQSAANFKQSVQRATLAVAPTTADDQAKTSIEQRRVSGRTGDHGLSTLYAELPTTDQSAVLAAVEDLARAWSRVEGETRTLDQLRADALVHLICADHTGRRPGPVINVCVALSTLIGEDDQAAQLGDGTSITAAQARLLAQDSASTWRRLVTDPLGRLIDYGRTTYRPPTALADFVRARDRHCTFPHCTRPAVRCDLDHSVDWAKGGSTSECNLHPLCERHHQAKHVAGWSVSVTADGASRWTSPTGRSYISDPPAYPIDRTAERSGRAPDADSPPGISDGGAPF